MNTKFIRFTFIISALLIALTFTSKAYSEDGEEFEVDGIKVILKPSIKEVINIRLFIEGGTANYSKEQEGIEALALFIAMNGGTKDMSRVEFNTELEKIGTTITTNADYDFGDINMTCLKPYWDKSWDLFTNALLNPAFSSEEFSIAQSQFISTAGQADGDPDAFLRNSAMAHVFEGKNYAKIPQGSVESLQSLTLNDVIQYYKDNLVKQKCFLVVAGDVSKEDISNKIRNSLAKLPEGEPAAYEDRIFITNPDQKIIDRDIATNYIRGVFSAPKITEKDGIPMRLAMVILAERYFIELRTKRSLSYAPSAFYSTGVLKNPYNVVYISTLDPKQSMEVMVDVIEDIKENGFTEEELKNKKETFFTAYYMNLATNSSQTQNLGRWEIAGDWSLAGQFNDMIENVSLEELNKAFDYYTNVINWTYLGDKDAVQIEDFKQIKKPEPELVP